VVLGLARAEGFQLIRSMLVVTGLLAGAATTWILIGPAEPLWWNVAWKLGFGQLVLGAAVLVAAHLATGRAQRNGMTDLYASFPATTGTRTLGQLAGLVGAVPASLLLIGATAVTVDLLGAVGTPSVALLAGGLLLVAAAGAVGIAIAARFPHPLAGLIGALALLFSSGTSHTASGSAIWLLPWQWTQDNLAYLPGPLAGYPPTAAHLLELGGIAVLAAAAALAATVSRARARAGLVTGGIVALAVICLAGALQLRPVPAAGLTSLVRESADPASVQRCTTANQVRYCLYPGFGRELPSLQAPVNAVLARLPARPGTPLTVMQVSSLSLPDATLTHGQPSQQVSRWEAQLQHAPGSTATASRIYVPAGSWPAAGGRLADARFDVALAAAEWAVGISTGAAGSPSGQLFGGCVPLDQAREAIAIWLAVGAAHLPASELQAGVSGPANGYPAVTVRNALVPVWTYPGWGAGYLAPQGGEPQDTAVGYLLASAMTRLPGDKVGRVLSGSWRTWVNVRTTDAQLATALGIATPSVHVPQTPPGQNHVTVNPGQGTGQNPVCAS
jgi:hypothetical protein